MEAAVIQEAAIIQALQAGLAHHQRGDLAQAAAIYQQVARLAPRHPEALHLLGLVTYQQGDHAAAVALLARAIELHAGIPEYYADLGNALRAQGDLAAANGCYREALRLNPQDAESYKNLGAVLHAQGNPSAAAGCYRAALRLNLVSADVYNGLGAVLHDLGDLDGAANSLGHAVRLDPGYAPAHNNLGVALREKGELAAAEQSCRAALRLAPCYAEAHNNLGIILAARGDLTGAIESYRAALRDRPHFVEAHNNLGNARREQGEGAAAIESYRAALRLDPAHVEVHTNLGNALRDQGEPDAAERHYREAVRLDPGHAEAHNGLGVVLHLQGNLREAGLSFKRAIGADATVAHYHNNLGAVLQELNALAEAEQSFRAAIRRNPDYPVAHNNLGNVLRGQGRHEEAMESYRAALRLDHGCGEARNYIAHMLQQACDWRELGGLCEQILRDVRDGTGALAPPYFVMTIADAPAEQLASARRWTTNRTASVARLREKLHFHFSPAPKERLRIGYLSADYRNHVVADLMAEIFELHDRRRVDVRAYSLSPDDGSPQRRRIVDAVDRFVDLHDRTHLEAARAIYEDGADVLVDLGGHTAGARMQILALRPAPLQAHYCGYPGTLGAGFVDYLIADPFIVPPTHQRFYAEKIAYLPDTAVPHDRQRAIGPTPSRAACSLPEEGFVWCCFNSPHKITPPLFDVWMRLLTQTPGSVLWLLDGGVAAVANLRREAEARGIDPQRLVFAPRVPLAEHLGRQRLINLFLDTLPYGAHSTAANALWAGALVLTCVGESFAARVGGSVLRAAGLPELITYSLDDYERTALRLARDRDLLAGLRRRLAENRDSCPLFNTARLTRNLEYLYRGMWDRLILSASPLTPQPPLPHAGEGERCPQTSPLPGEGEGPGVRGCHPR